MRTSGVTLLEGFQAILHRWQQLRGSLRWVYCGAVVLCTDGSGVGGGLFGGP